MARKIFINYRRDDSSATAGRLRDRLAQVFNEDNVFMDVDSIPAGVDFADYLESQIASCDVCLVLIGLNWLDTKDEHGRRRLDDPNDYVTVEIAAALTRNIRVVPVTIDGARIPTADELPAPIKPLARRNAADIRNIHFHNDVDALIENIGSRARWERWPLKAAGVVIVVLLAAGIGVSQWPWRKQPDKQPEVTPSPTVVAARPEPAVTSPPPTAPTTPNASPSQAATSASPVASSTPPTPPTPAVKPPEEPIDKFTVSVNRDIYGQDIVQPDGRVFIPDLNINACAAQCEHNKLCEAFSFDRWTNRCYLKNKIANPLLDARSISAVKKPSKLPEISTAPSVIDRTPNYRFHGKPSARKKASNFQECKAICEGDRNCVAVSFLKTAGGSENCEIFNAAEQKYVADDSADSGFKRQSQ
jgi:hypothetical protein